MLIPLIIFIVSGFGIVSLVGIKTYQLSAGIRLPLATKRNALESGVKRAEEWLRARAMTIKKSLHATELERFVVGTGVGAKRLGRKLTIAMTTPGHWLDRRTRNLVSLVRGRQNLPKKSEPSSYMRDISRR